jgi:2-C-methyl-D-erythritol 2,4-cyclodiphosphate synthase
MRIGIGFDIHPLQSGRPLVIGGVTIPHDRGLLGHSDGDVLIHAIADGILGALGLGDIGRIYPDSDPAFKDLCSLRILDDLVPVLARERMRIENLDAVIIAEAPRLSPFIDAIRESLSKHLRIDFRRINIKAKSAEKLGALGKGEGIAVHAAVLLLPDTGI